MSGHFLYWTNFSVVWFEPDQVLSFHPEIWANFPTGSQLADWIAGEPETQMLFTDAWFSRDVFYSVMQAHPLSGGYPSGNHVLEGGELLLRFHHSHQCHGWPRDVLALVYFLAGIWMLTVDIHHHHDQWSYFFSISWKSSLAWRTSTGCGWYFSMNSFNSWKKCFHHAVLILNISQLLFQSLFVSLLGHW